MLPLFTQNLVNCMRVSQADPSPHNIETNETLIGIAAKYSSRFKKKVATWRLSKATSYIASMTDNGLVDRYINLAEDKRTATAKAGPRNKGHLDKISVKNSLSQKGWEAGQTLATTARKPLRQVQQRSTKRAHFATRPKNQ